MPETSIMDPDSEKPLFARFYLPLSLVLAHALFAALVVYVRYGPGWDANTFTIFVLDAFLFLDYPIIALIQLMDHQIFRMTGEAFPWALLALGGSAYWFVIGCVLQGMIRHLRRRWR